MSIKTVLTVIDVTGTQNYIFTSNRLRESIGASYLVAQATSWWIFEILNQTFPGKTNIDSTKNALDSKSPFEAFLDKRIENGLDAEAIYVGGGNALILFKAEGVDGKEKAKTFTREYTKKLLRDAPGLEVVIAHSSPFDIGENEKEFNNEEDLAIRLQLAEAMKKITEKKAYRKISAPLLGLAVSAQCASTGKTASVNPLHAARGDEELETLIGKYKDKYVSADVLAKLFAVREANKKLEDNLFGAIKQKKEVREKLGEENAAKLSVPFEFDNLGKTEGETGLIAVVHTDGNGMGNRIKAVGESEDIKTNRDWIRAMRSFSAEIDEANLVALQKTAAFLASKLSADEKTGEVILKAGNGRSFVLGRRRIYDRKTRSQKEIICYPFRPIIFGGEDIAFVCDARIALDLTAFYLKELEKIKLKTDGKPIYGRAGIAVVKAHYPFRRAYDLAEDLARNAKKRIEDVESSAGAGDVLTMDWHVAFGGLAGNLEEIRRREYKDGNLCMRPVSIGKKRDGSDWRTLENFVSITEQFQTDWAEMRNKAKTLRDVLRGGENETEQFVKLNRGKIKDDKLPTFEVNEIEDFRQKGWQHGGRCAYFDALEMMDLYFPLEAVGNVENQNAGDERK